MAGHPLLNQVRTKNEVVVVNNRPYTVILSYNKVAGIDGYVVGLKFTDADGNMDSTTAKPTHAMPVALAIAHRAMQMLKPDLPHVAILGFYLLTGDLETRSPLAKKAKIRVYNNRAKEMHKSIHHRLPYLARLEAEGGAAWIFTEKSYNTYEQFNFLENELAKQIRTEIC